MRPRRAHQRGRRAQPADDHRVAAYGDYMSREHRLAELVARRGLSNCVRAACMRSAVCCARWKVRKRYAARFAAVVVRARAPRHGAADAAAAIQPRLREPARLYSVRGGELRRLALGAVIARGARKQRQPTRSAPSSSTMATPSAMRMPATKSRSATSTIAVAACAVGMRDRVGAARSRRCARADSRSAMIVSRPLPLRRIGRRRRTRSSSSVAASHAARIEPITANPTVEPIARCALMMPEAMPGALRRHRRHRKRGDRREAQRAAECRQRQTEQHERRVPWPPAISTPSAGIMIARPTRIGERRADTCRRDGPRAATRWSPPR